MRVAIAGLHTETNAFSPVPADLSAFDAAGVLRGGEIRSQLEASHHTVAGFMRACRDAHAEVVPLVYANAWALGTITDEAFDYVVAEILDALSTQGPFDVVLLAQHGAAVADGYPDADGELVARVRSLLGPDVVIGVGLDLHANVSDRLIEAVDVAVGYRENPHSDPLVRGAECAELALRVARGDVRPVQRLVRLPMVVPILGGWTAAGRMREVMLAADRIAAEHAVLSHTVFHGFGYADVRHMGSCVLVIAESDADVAEGAAHEIAACLWDGREALQGHGLTPAAAFSEARRCTAGAPTVLLDVGDNIGGGAPGDSTVLLAEAIDRRVEGIVVALCDADAVEHASAAGLGAEAEVGLGATTPVSVGPRLTVRGRVSRITDGRFEDERVAHAGFRHYEGGPTVRLTTEAGQELVISSRAVPPFSPEQLRAVGIEPRDQRIIVAKGVVAPRAGYESVTSAFLAVDTPGITGADLSRFRYRARPRPLWPLEADAVWTHECARRSVRLADM